MKRSQISPLVGKMVVIGALALAPACSAFAQAKEEATGGGAYDRLPTDRLIKQMSFLGMTQLLEALEQEVPPGEKSAKAFAMRGRIRVGLANAMEDPAERNKLLDEAIPLLRQAVKLSDKKASPSPAETLEMFHYALELAVATGRYRVENPHVLRLRHLQGGAEDRKVILKYTKEAVDLVDFLREDVADTLTDWRPDMNLLMIWVPALEDLEREVKYNAAWIRLHRAMALSDQEEDGGEKAQLCRDIIAEMRTFTGDRDSGVMYWALYVTGIAHRLMKQHDKAEEMLGKAAVPEAGDRDLRQRAWFERARNRIEEGKTAEAEKAIGDFERGSLAIWGPDKQVMVDLRVILLRNYLYEVLARKAKNLADARDLRAKGQEVLLTFVEKYADRPDLVKAFLDIVATKFADVEDLDAANAIVILARAYTKVESKDPKDQAEAEKLLQKVLVHRDMKSPRIANSIRPGVLWELAFLMNKAKRNIDAARYFANLARLHPKHRLASRSAQFAVRSLYAVVQERLAKGKMIEANLRMAYIQAIDTLLAGWPNEEGEEGVGKRNFDLASQCMNLSAGTQNAVVKLHWQGRAIAAYEKVPSSLLEYMEAQHSALGLRTEIVLGRDDLAELLKDDNVATKEQLRLLAAELLGYEQVGGVPASPGPATAPAGPSAEQVTGRAEALHKQLTERLKLYSDPGALTTRLKTYSDEAEKESNKLAADAKAAADDKKKELQAVADGLREWAAQADYQAAVIKYEQLPRGKTPAEKQAIEKEALTDLRRIIEKWPGTGVLRNAYEFEIRKLIERGQTAEAIDKIGDFKKLYPEQSRQLIELVVAQIQEQIKQIGSRLSGARTATEAEKFQTELRKYQLDYARFAEDLFKVVKDLPIDQGRLDQQMRDIGALEKKRDFDGLLKLAEEFPQLAAECRVDPNEIKAAAVLDNVTADAKRPGVNKAEILPNLAGALINAVIGVREAVRERCARHQMYGDALIQRGKAEQMRSEALEAKGAFQAALAVFEKCFAMDEAKRKVHAEFLEAQYGPRIEAIRAEAKSMDVVGRMIEEFKKELVAIGDDPNDSPDVSTLRFAYDFLRKAERPEQERERLPRVRNLLIRGWEKALEKRKTRLIVDHLNVIGLAKAHWGLKQYGKAMEYFRNYTGGVPENSKVYWPAQLERCKCHLEGYRDSIEAMKNLVIHINILQYKDKSMGGLAREFESIRREAQSIIDRAKSSGP
ncbi:MAG: hypothetical protein WBF17_16940 [Phycisphaerae bacterium]